MILDFRNNILYNWGYRGGYTWRGPSYVNYVKNYLKAGPTTKASIRTRVFEPGDDTLRIFLTGNVMAGGEAETHDNRLLIKPKSGFDKVTLLDTVTVDGAFPAPPVRTDGALEARERVLAQAGATLPKRDSADQRLMEEVRTGTGRIIDSPAEVGG